MVLPHAMGYVLGAISLVTGPPLANKTASKIKFDNLSIISP